MIFTRLSLFAIHPFPSFLHYPLSSPVVNLWYVCNMWYTPMCASLSRGWVGHETLDDCTLRMSAKVGGRNPGGHGSQRSVNDRLGCHHHCRHGCPQHQIMTSTHFHHSHNISLGRRVKCTLRNGKWQCLTSPFKHSQIGRALAIYILHCYRVVVS